MKLKFAVLMTLFSLPALLVSTLQIPTATARETVITSIENAPYPERLGDCLSDPIGPVLYGNRDFRGRIYKLNRSNARFSDGNNDTATSICVPYGWGLIIYKRKDFNGRSLQIGPGQVTTRIRDNLNDDATSARVYRVDARGNWIEQ